MTQDLWRLGVGDIAQRISRREMSARDAVASVLAFRLRRNLQVAISGDVNVLDSAQEFAGEIDAVDLDATAKAGARLSYLLKKLL